MSGEQYKDKRFIEWAKRQGGQCCVCRANTGASVPAAELHHYDPYHRGMGMKGRDHWVARLCRSHHEQLQGKGRRWFMMTVNMEAWAAMLEDTVNLLSDYIVRNKVSDENNGEVF